MSITKKYGNLEYVRILPDTEALLSSDYNEDNDEEIEVKYVHRYPTDKVSSGSFKAGIWLRKKISNIPGNFRNFSSMELNEYDRIFISFRFILNNRSK